MAAVFSLLVGINNYHPQSSVPGLNGCTNDIDAMHDYIQKKFPNTPASNIMVLKNEQATRQAVLENFQNHLIKNPNIKAGDTLLFYYSGHGSQAPSAPEFVALNEDSEKLDETLVLYDSRLPGHFDLADKELALLLSCISKDAHAVVILDSCHSGSATRDLSRADEIKLGAVRFTSRSDTPRALKDYVEIDGHGYLKMFTGKVFQIPKSKHLLLAACGRNEVAYESQSARGLFSNQLTDYLERADVNTSYATLYESLYTLIKRKAARQAPQLKVYHGFNPNLIFLQDETSTGKPQYNLVYKQEASAWVINYGALQGLPPDADAISNSTVQLYAINDASKPLYTATLQQVGLNESILTMPSGVNTQQSFNAEVLNLPPALVIYVDGETADRNRYFSMLEKSIGDYWTLRFHQDAQLFQNLILDVRNNQLVIRDARTKELLHGVETITNESVDYIIDALLQIAKWKALEQLENKQTTIPEGDIQFVFQVQDSMGNWQDCSGDQLTFDITPERNQIPFNIRLENTSNTPYYFALYDLSSGFSILKFSSDIDASLLRKGATPALMSDNGNLSLIIDDDNSNEETEIFKLVYSPEIFQDYFVEEQRELERKVVKLSGEKGIKLTKKPSHADWATKTISVRVVRQLQQVNKTQGYSNTIVSIKPHPTFQAAVSITPIDTAAKSYNPAAILQQVFSEPNFELLDVSERSRGDAAPPQAVIELSDIQEEDTLENAPLEINLNYKLAEDEQVMAVTYSDDVVLPVGILEKSGDSDIHTMKLYRAPAQQDAMRTAATRSPIRALWFCFLKVVLKKDDEVFKLRYITYENGKADYATDNVSEKIRQSQKMVLVIHGIIGNTKSLVVNMEPFLKAGTYDCILAFDYENLNTSIGEIAAELKKRLEQNRITAQNRIDIIAHSMGGLVSRYMIEQLGGDALVRRLFLVGTPNNGSSFGKIVTFRNWATGVLTLVCNYGKSFLGSFGVFLQGVNAVLGATKPITNTLAEMGENSDFLKGLNSTDKPVQTRYFIIAGNTKNYTLPDESPAKKTIEKIELAIGKLAYWTVANDIAVSVDSIKHVPTSKVEKVVELGCHHLNYFDYDVSMQQLTALVQQ